MLTVFKVGILGSRRKNFAPPVLSFWLHACRKLKLTDLKQGCELEAAALFEFKFEKNFHIRVQVVHFCICEYEFRNFYQVHAKLKQRLSSLVLTSKTQQTFLKSSSSPGIFILKFGKEVIRVERIEIGRLYQ